MRAVLTLGMLLATAGVAQAADVAGWYAGIYAGASSRTDAALSTAVASGGFNHRGTIEHPVAVVNSPVRPIDPALLDVANIMLAASPFTSTGSVDGTIQDGVLHFDPAFTLDFAVGYTFGNGGRIEAHYSGAPFEARRFLLEPGFSDNAFGTIDKVTGVWTWSKLPFDLHRTVDGGSGSVEEVFGLKSYVTRADFLLIDGWYDVDTGTVVSPYVGGGIGMARVTNTALYDCACGSPAIEMPASTAYVPAAELGAGVRVKLADPLTLDLGYRYRMAASSRLGFNYIGSDGVLPVLLSYHQSGPVSVQTLTAGLVFALP